MTGKFRTTSSSLYTSQNNENTPNWMEGLDIEIAELETPEIEFSNKALFAEKQTVSRDFIDGTPRMLEASFNDAKMTTDANIQLAKLLTGKYYKVEPKVHGNHIDLHAKIDGVPSELKFSFVTDNGKLTNINTFSVLTSEGESEYPFSKAGLEECIGDIKANKIRTAKKVEGVNKAFIINREEIIRRFNGQLRPATEKINELLQKGDLMGVGSNTYASIYDPEFLFPQMQKEAAQAPLPAFEFAPNREHVAAKPHSSAEVLSTEAAMMLKSLFPDFNIISSFRDENELLIKANILGQNGMVVTCDLNFGIEKDKVNSLKVAEINDHRMTCEQLLKHLNMDNRVLEAYLAQPEVKATKRIYRGVVLTPREIHRKLASVLKKETIDGVIENWIERGLLTKVNSTTFTTTHSFENLLNSIVAKTLSGEELKELNVYKKAFASFEPERMDVEDTGVRDMEQHVSRETLLAKANEFLSRHFQNFKPESFDATAPESLVYTIQLFDEKTGLSSTINFAFGMEGNNVIACHANYNGRMVEINNVREMFASNDVLKKYLATSQGNKVNAPMVMSINSLKSRLASISNASDAEINDVLASWELTNKISKLDSNTFGSKYTFEQLLALSNLKSLSDEEIKARLAKSKMNKELLVSANYQEDSGSRSMIAEISEERLLLTAKSELNRLYKDYQIVDASIGSNSYTIVARVVNPRNGLRQRLSFNFKLDNNKLSSLASISDGKQTVQPFEIHKFDNKDEAVETFINYHGTSERNYKNLLSKTQLRNKLLCVANIDKIDELTHDLIANEILNPINSVTFASDYSLTEIVAYLSRTNSLSVEEGKANTTLAMRDENSIQISDFRTIDSKTRTIESAEKTLSPVMLKYRDKLAKTNDIALERKLIVAKAHGRITESLNNAKCENDLVAICKELQRWIGDSNV